MDEAAGALPRYQHVADTLIVIALREK